MRWEKDDVVAGVSVVRYGLRLRVLKSCDTKKAGDDVVVGAGAVRYEVSEE